MATDKPRIQVTVKPSQYELLKRLAKLQKRSMASILGELLDEIEPVYERVAVVLQAAVRAQSSMNQGFVESAQRAEAELAPLVAQAMGQLDMLVERTEGSEGAGRAAESEANRGAPGASAAPASVTRGSGLPKHTHKPAQDRSPNLPLASHKPRNLRAIRKPPGRSINRLASAIAREVRRGPKKGRR